MRLLNTGNLEEMLRTRKRIYRTTKNSPDCPQPGECFARRNGKCMILSDTDFGKHDCPFQKADRIAK